MPSDDVRPENKEGERKLLGESSLIRALFSLSNEAILVVDAKGVIVASGGKPSSFLGFEAPEQTGMEIFDVASKDIRKEIKEALESVSSTGTAVRKVCEVGGSCLDLEVLPLQISEGRGGFAVRLREVPITFGERRMEKIFEAVTKVTEAVAKAKDFKEAYGIACRIAVEDIGFVMAWVGVVDESEQLVKPVARFGRDEGYLDTVRFSILEIPEGIGPVGTAVRENRAVMCNDIEKDPTFVVSRKEAGERGYASCLALPLTVEERAIGVLTLYSGEKNFFDSEKARILGAIARSLSLALEAFEREEKRRAAEENLRRSERHFRRLIENTSDIILIVNSTGTITYATPSIQRVLGYRRMDVWDRNLLDFVHVEDAKVLEEAQKFALRNPGSSTKAMLRLHHKNETWRNIEAILNGVLEDTGEANVVINARDVTERILAEEAQKKDRDFIMAVLDTTRALVVVLSLDGRIILFNKTCEETTGFRLDELRGSYLVNILVPKDERNQVGFVLERLGSGVQAIEFEGNLLTKDGRRRLISWSGSTLGGDGKKPEYVILTGIDITERREAERALKQSEERYRTVFESTRSAMCIVSEDGTLQVANREFERMVGKKSTELQGKYKFTDFLPPEDEKVFEQCRDGALLKGSDELLYHEFTIIGEEGRKTYALGTMAQLPGTSSLVVSLADITKEKEYELDLKERADRLRHFLIVASHELRHPITVIKGYANTLVEYMEQMSKDMVYEILDDIDGSTTRLTHLVDELMDISKIEEGRVIVETKEVEPKSIIDTAIEDLKVMGFDNEVKVKIEEGIGKIQADPDKITQVLSIILENAAKFSPRSSLIEVELKKENEKFVFSVLDRGPGVPEADREKIFDRFYQVTDALHHSIPGIGLGLYIAREIVNAHGGKVWHEPREGGGSIFLFTIPRG